MVADAFAHVDCWVFDLDKTLYPPDDQVFDQIGDLMTLFIARTLGVDPDRASRIRDEYWHRYGTTLAGLMAEHGVEPEAFMIAVHEVDMGHMRPDPALRAAIAALPGKRVVYTNGSEPYAHRILAARGLTGVFDAVYGVEHAGYVPKPEQAAFEAVFALGGIAPERGAMFEDDVRNLTVPHALGMRTVHVAPEALAQDHVHHHTDDLAGFLSQLRG